MICRFCLLGGKAHTVKDSNVQKDKLIQEDAAKWKMQMYFS